MDRDMIHRGQNNFCSKMYFFFFLYKHGYFNIGVYRDQSFGVSLMWPMQEM